MRGGLPCKPRDRTIPLDDVAQVCMPFLICVITDVMVAAYSVD